MTQLKLNALSERELYEMAVDLWQRMGEVYFSSKRLYRRYFDQETAVLVELKSRSPDAFRILLPALSHEDPWVRYGAAMGCYNEAAEDATAAFKEIERVLPYHMLGYLARGFLGHRARGLPFPIPRDYPLPLTIEQETDPLLRKIKERVKQMSDRYEAERRSKR